MTIQTINLVQNVLASNDDAARKNRKRFTDAGVLAVNVIASPGAGKTSVIVKTLQALRGRARVGVIEGDIAGVIDTERVLEAGAQDAVQINTGGNCHLEANMVERALGELDLNQLDIVFIENVGNLVCPTHWALGEELKLCLSSTAEGHDKPLKYPEIFALSDVIILNKTDLSQLVDFDRTFFRSSVRALNPHAPLYEISCRTGYGVAAWVDWIECQMQRVKQQEAAHVH